MLRVALLRATAPSARHAAAIRAADVVLLAPPRGAVWYVYKNAFGPAGIFVDPASAFAWLAAVRAAVRGRDHDGGGRAP